jgi:Flp pilus assembly protein TadD
LTSFILLFLNCRFGVAESDCNLAIALSRTYAKAYARRGAARFALQKLEDARRGINTFQIIII